MFTKMEAAKEVTTITLAAVFATGIDKLLTHTTDLDEDGIVVRAGSGIGGWMIANSIRDYTDAGVECVAAKVTQIRENRKTKKEAAQTETP
jgi:hypothetical protein